MVGPRNQKKRSVLQSTYPGRTKAVKGNYINCQKYTILTDLFVTSA